MGLYNPANIKPLLKVATTESFGDSSAATGDIVLDDLNSKRFQSIIFNGASDPILITLNNIDNTTDTSSFYSVKLEGGGAYITPEGYFGKITARTIGVYRINVTTINYL